MISIISFMITMPPLKRTLTVGPNEPRPNSSSLMIHRKKILVAKDPREMILSLEEQMEF